MTSSLHPYDPWTWQPDAGYQVGALSWQDFAFPVPRAAQRLGVPIPTPYDAAKDFDFSGVAKIAAVVGVCVLGYFVYRQFAVTGGTVRGLKESVASTMSEGGT